MNTSTAARYSATASSAELAEFIPAIQTLADQAAVVIKKFFLKQPEVLIKQDASPVTQADQGAEEVMRTWIEQHYPSHAILGEEFGEKAGTSYRWVLDPVDGTRAFISHAFLFGTLIALERDDGAGFVPILGCIAHPAAGVSVIGCATSTRLYAADGSQRPAQVRACTSLSQATLLMTSLWMSGEQKALHTERIEHLARAAKLVRTWGDCFGYFSLATGGADIMLDPVCAYWDVAALLPVLEGAGAVVSSWTGGNPLLAPSLLAAGPSLHPQLLQLLHGES